MPIQVLIAHGHNVARQRPRIFLESDPELEIVDQARDRAPRHGNGVLPVSPHARKASIKPLFVPQAGSADQGREMLVSQDLHAETDAAMADAVCSFAPVSLLSVDRVGRQVTWNEGYIWYKYNTSRARKQGYLARTGVLMTLS